METTSPRFNSNAASIFQFSPPDGKRAPARAKKRGVNGKDRLVYERRIRTRKEARLRVAGFGGPM